MPTVTSGGGVSYVESTWTPVIGGAGGQSGQTYTSQAGSYKKIGNLVVAAFTVTLSAKGTITGVVQVSGLPFASASPSGTLMLGYQNLATNWVHLKGLVSGSVVLVRGTTVAAMDNEGALTTTDITNTTQFTGTVIYATT
jgi:hypothetical protein